MFSWDSDANGQLDSVTEVGGFAPEVHVRLARSGTRLTGSCSSDGRNWAVVGVGTVPDAAAAEDVGMFVSAVDRHTGQEAIATFAGGIADSPATTRDTSGDRLQSVGRPVTALNFETGRPPEAANDGSRATSGYFPFAVTAVRREIHRTFPPTGHGRFRHINTFGGHPVGCAIAVAIMEREDLFTRAHRAGELLRAELAGLAGHPLVGQIRGKGLLTGIELVLDKETKQPADVPTVRAVLAECLRRGLIVGTNANTAAGLANVITVGPPLTVSDDEISYLAETLRESIVSRPDGCAADG